MRVCEFRFVEVRGLGGAHGCSGGRSACCANGCCECMQIGEIRLFNASGAPLAIASSTSPYGLSPRGEGASNAADAADGDDDCDADDVIGKAVGGKAGGVASGRMHRDCAVGAKWLDTRLGDRGSSVLELRLPVARGVPTSYALFTANDAPARDPTAWAVFCLHEDDDGVHVLGDTRAHVTPPQARGNSYAPLPLHALSTAPSADNYTSIASPAQPIERHFAGGPATLGVMLALGPIFGLLLALPILGLACALRADLRSRLQGALSWALSPSAMGVATGSGRRAGTRSVADDPSLRPMLQPVSIAPLSDAPMPEEEPRGARRHPSEEML